MRRVWTFYFIAFLSVCLSGCYLLPKDIELGQKKVKPIPNKTEKTQERERQAAALLEELNQIAYAEALKEGASPSVTDPLGEANALAPALSDSLGPPMKPYSGNITNLINILMKAQALLNEDLREARERNKELEGKKIEGTGFIQMNYFVAAGGTLFVIWLLVQGVKIYGMINPAVGVGLNIAKVPVKAITKAASELIEGGEEFKKKVEAKITDKETIAIVKELFRQSQLEKQSRDTQTLIKNLTQK